MTYLAAAEAVLKSAGKALTTLELTDEAIRRGLIKPSGKTPVKTMSAALYTAVLDTRSAGRIGQQAVPGPVRAKRNTVKWAWNGR